MEPVTAMMWGGSFTRPRASGHTLRANCPGRELPLPTSPPINRRTLHRITAKTNLMFMLPLAVV